MLEAGDQRHMLDALAINGIQQVAHHAALTRQFLGLGGLAQPGGDEDMARAEIGQRPAGRRSVRQVDGNVKDAGRQVMLVAGNAGDDPAFREQPFGEMPADDAGDAGNERVAGHQFSPSVFRVTLMQASGFWPSLKASTASVRLKWWVWIGDRSMPVFSRKRMAAGQTPASRCSRAR